MKRVVVTGMAGISPIGDNWESIQERLEALETGIRRMDSWDVYDELNTRLGRARREFRNAIALPAQGPAQHGARCATCGAQQRAGA